MRLDELLIKHGVITKDQAKRAEAEMWRRGCRFGEALVSLGILSPCQVEVFLGEQERTRSTSLFAKSRAVLRMMRATAQSTAARFTEAKV
jgi:hypothetical protein